VELLALSPTACVVAAALLGLIVGSFLNVVIYRLPLILDRQWRAECAQAEASSAPPASSEQPAPFNLIVPRSACASCHRTISAIHNIPVLSFVLLRGRCAYCQARISLRYPAVELLTGALTVLVVLRFGLQPATVCALLVTWFLIALAFIDVDHQLLPDSMTLPLLWLGLLASLTGWSAMGSNLPVDPVSAIGGAAAGYLSLWLIYHGFRLLTGKEGMGYGDFKLLAALGAWLGLQMLLPIVLLSALVGALVGMTLILLRRQDRGTPIPFGPFLAAAGWLAMMWGPQLVARYLHLYSAGGA
jgi:leader peptidase (prepilin peptidase) / N-methyltransferase